MARWHAYARYELSSWGVNIMRERALTFVLEFC